MYGSLDVLCSFCIRRLSTSHRILYLLNCSYPEKYLSEADKPSRNKKLEDRDQKNAGNLTL